MISIIIPTRNEKYLNRTIKDIQTKASSDIEIIAVLDGYDTQRLDGVKYIHHPKALGMRYAINSANGGRVVFNKNTWYAHRHNKFPRTHNITHGSQKENLQIFFDAWKDYYYKEIKPKWKI